MDEADDLSQFNAECRAILAAIKTTPQQHRIMEFEALDSRIGEPLCDFENSVISIDDTLSLTENSVIDLDSSRFAVQYSPVNLVSDTSCSTSDVEIVDIYRVPFGVSAKRRKIKGRSPALARSLARKQKTENSTCVDKENDEDSGWKSGPIGACPVCLECPQRQDIMSTICGHVFCEPCIRSVVSKSKSCPVCRKRLTLKSIHPIYL